MNVTNSTKSIPKVIILSALLAASSVTIADHRHNKHQKHPDKQGMIAYGKVLNVTPVYREYKVSTPVKECWREPVRQTKRVRRGSNSAGGTLAGGLIGGIIGHQFGKGRGQQLSTAVGTLIGAQLGHDAVRGGSSKNHSSYTRYEDFCGVENLVSYEEELDSYKVIYRYKGNKYQTNMPYDPGKKIKLKISIEPVF